MSQAHARVILDQRLVKIGSEVFAVYGDDVSGWSTDPKDLSPRVPMEFRYRTFAELFFALVNMNFTCEGKA